MLTLGELVIDARRERVVPVWHRSVRRNVIDCRAEGAIRRWKVAQKRFARCVDSPRWNYVAWKGGAIAGAARDRRGIVYLDSCTCSAHSADEVRAQAGEIARRHGWKWNQ